MWWSRQVFRVRIARTDAERARGLSFVRALAPWQGMMFVFPTEARHTFTNARTYVPLDLVTVSAEGRVQEVIPMATETSPPTLYTPSLPFRIALELRQGSTLRDGVRPGTRLYLPAA